MRRQEASGAASAARLPARCRVVSTRNAELCTTAENSAEAEGGAEEAIEQRGTTGGRTHLRYLGLDNWTGTKGTGGAGNWDLVMSDLG